MNTEEIKADAYFKREVRDAIIRYKNKIGKSEIAIELLESVIKELKCQKK